MRGLYPIVDAGVLAEHGVPLLEFAERVLAIRPPLVQLRAKRLPAGKILTILRELLPKCRAAGSELIVNDRADLALLAGAGFVHVGQDDLLIAEVRRIAPALRIGVSTHDLAQLEAALDARPDYVAFGPIFATHTKENPDPVVGLDGLARASTLARNAGIPLVAIGGIDLESAARVGELADMAAVIAALVPRDGTLEGVEARARDFHRRLGGVG